MLFVLAVVLGLFSSALGFSPRLGAEISNNRIVGGVEAVIEDFPYMISLRYFSSHTCGGGILNNNTIITAAHCVHNRTPTQFSIRAGATYKNEGGVVINAAEVHIHERYNTTDLDNDIAIIKLATELEFGDGIATIDLPPYEEFDLPGDTLTSLAGWGRTEYQGSTSDRLLSVVIPVIDRDQCAEWYAEYDAVHDRQMCAGIEGKDACQGDSGGPLVYDNNGTLIVVGLVSWGDGCAWENAPSVFARVSKHLEWIAQFI